MIGELPKTLSVNGKVYAIRTDFRDVLKIVCAFEDAELEDSEKIYICLFILYEDFESMSESDYEAAFQAALEFIDHGGQQEKAKSPRIMDWEQDENILFPAINKVAGFETRAVEYLHWWTFLGYFMEITDGVFSQVLGIRTKKAKHKKLDKWEREFYSKNKTLCVLRPKLTAQEEEAKNKLNKLLG